MWWVGTRLGGSIKGAATANEHPSMSKVLDRYLLDAHLILSIKAHVMGRPTQFRWSIKGAATANKYLSISALTTSAS